MTIPTWRDAEKQAYKDVHMQLQFFRSLRHLPPQSQRLLSFFPQHPLFNNFCFDQHSLIPSNNDLPTRSLFLPFFSPLHQCASRTSQSGRSHIYPLSSRPHSGIFVLWQPDILRDSARWDRQGVYQEEQKGRRATEQPRSTTSCCPTASQQRINQRATSSWITRQSRRHDS